VNTRDELGLDNYTRSKRPITVGNKKVAINVESTSYYSIHIHIWQKGFPEEKIHLVEVDGTFQPAPGEYISKTKLKKILSNNKIMGILKREADILKRNKTTCGIIVATIFIIPTVAYSMETDTYFNSSKGTGETIANFIAESIFDEATAYAVGAFGVKIASLFSTTITVNGTVAGLSFFSASTIGGLSLMTATLAYEAGGFIGSQRIKNETISEHIGDAMYFAYSKLKGLFVDE